MPPTIARNYVRGQLGGYQAQSVALVDKHLRRLRKRLRERTTPQIHARVRHDVDLLLDARLVLMRLAA